MNFDAGKSFQNGLTTIFDYIPAVIGAILLLILGYIIAKILQSIIQKLLRRLRFDHALHTSPAGKYIVRVVESPSRLVGRITFWVVFLIFISFAASAINIQVLNHILNGIYSYIPRIIAAIIIFLVASAFSVGAAAFVQRVMGKTALSKIISSIVPALVMSIATFMILDQLNIGKDIVLITYAAIMSSLALGLALAFGLGGRDVARQMLEQAYAAGQRTAPAAKEEISRAKERTKRDARNTRDKMA